MIAKCLQNLANLIEFGGKVKSIQLNSTLTFRTVSLNLFSSHKEPYMEVVNPFILKNKERMILFLDQLSNVTDPNPPPGPYMENNSNHKCFDTGNVL